MRAHLSGRVDELVIAAVARLRVGRELFVSGAMGEARFHIHGAPRLRSWSRVMRMRELICAIFRGFEDSASLRGTPAGRPGASRESSRM